MKGHGLVREGAPYAYDAAGQVVSLQKSWGGVSGKGRGLCACGALSDVLPSAQQRKQWHRKHKQQVAEEGR